ncbi:MULTISPECIES: hypothetical protein [Phenylobacterium]|uniref:Uncharacterized protein n=1 Tax=Phenylobacterium koreense TaxID=266125 RepID=A0ABV2EF51_9CAUL
MPKELFEVASPFEEPELDMVEALDAELDAESVEINARRAQAEHPENLRLARAI